MSNGNIYKKIFPIFIFDGIRYGMIFFLITGGGKEGTINRCINKQVQVITTCVLCVSQLVATKQELVKHLHCMFLIPNHHVLRTFTGIHNASKVLI